MWVLAPLSANQGCSSSWELLFRTIIVAIAQVDVCLDRHNPSYGNNPRHDGFWFATYLARWPLRIPTEELLRVGKRPFLWVWPLFLCGYEFGHCCCHGWLENCYCEEPFLVRLVCIPWSLNLFWKFPLGGLRCDWLNLGGMLNFFLPKDWTNPCFCMKKARLLASGTRIKFCFSIRIS